VRPAAEGVDGAGPVEGTAPRGRARVGSLVLPARVLLVGVLLAALVVAGMLLVRHRQATAQQALRDDVLAAARQEAVNFTTLDYRQLDRDLGRVLDGAGGSFKQQFQQQSDQLRQLVTANKAVSVGQVLDAGLVSLDGDSARVLVVADSRVTNTGAPDGQLRRYRMQLDLVRSADGPTRGRWLTSDLQFVG
jgi:Mce-associated membrane protein